jgi:hypothetical protein
VFDEVVIIPDRMLVLLVEPDVCLAISQTPSYRINLPISIPILIGYRGEIDNINTNIVIIEPRGGRMVQRDLKNIAFPPKIPMSNAADESPAI